MWRIAARLSEYGPSVPRTMIHTTANHTGTEKPSRAPSMDVLSVIIDGSKVHHGFATAQNMAPNTNM
jgi:hypothetical protein